MVLKPITIMKLYLGENDCDSLSDDYLKSKSAAEYARDYAEENFSASDVNKTCSWCNKSFSETHYTHLGKMAPCQSSTNNNSIGMWCSMECCNESRRSSCRNFR